MQTLTQARSRSDHHVVLGIDALRFACAMMVMLFHLGFWITRSGTTPYAASGGRFDFPTLAPMLSVGRMGVEIFFVVSGFVIAFSAQRSSASAFLRGRILRLAPAAWICATVTLAVALACGDGDPLTLIGAWVRSVTFSPYGPYVDGVYWTLAIELAFYAMVLSLIYMDAMHQIDRLFLAVAAVSTGFSLLVFVIAPEWQALAGDRTLKLALIVNGSQFAVGVFLWQLLYKGGTPIRWTGLAIGLVGGGIETAKFVTEQHDRVLALCLWLAAIVAIAASVHWNARIAVAIGARGKAILRGAGLATYPLYLLHQLVGATMMGWLAQAGVPPIACLTLVVASLVAASWFIAVRVEPLMRARLTSLLRPDRRAGDPAGARPRVAVQDASLIKVG